MKVLILNPSFGKDFVRVARWAAKSRGRVQRHPEFLLTAAQILLDNGHEVEFVEAAARNFTPEHSFKLARAFGPGLVVIHATTPSIYNDIEQAKIVKEQNNCKIAFVGQHVTAEPDNTFHIGKGVVDYILRREYDYTLLELADGKDPADILGLSWWDTDCVRHNPERPELDVTKLPFPAWQLIKPEWYPDGGKKFPFLTLITGRGCNNACTFCRDPQLMYGYRLRNRTADQVADEMEYDLKVHPQIREIMFETDTFAADKQHVTDVCHAIIKRGLHKRITWSCNMRTNTDVSVLPLMREAGCRMLMTGYEFGTNEQLRVIRKGGVSIEKAREYTHAAHKLGFTIHGCFMIGAPGETRDSARATIDFAKSLPLDTIQITGVSAYPGTTLYKWAKEKGFLTAKDWDEWLTAQKEQKTLLNYPQLSSQEIDELIDTGLKEYYLRPKQIWNMLISIRSVGDFLRKLHGFKAFVDYFFKKLSGQLNRPSSKREFFDRMTQSDPVSL